MFQKGAQRKLAWPNKSEIANLKLPNAGNKRASKIKINNLSDLHGN